MIILKMCWWFIKILLVGVLFALGAPIYLLLLALFPKAANVLLLLILGMWDSKR